MILVPALVLAATTLAVGTADAAQPVGGAKYEPPAMTDFGEAAVTLVVDKVGTTVRGKAVDNCALTYRITSTKVADSGTFEALGKTDGGSEITLKGEFTHATRSRGPSSRTPATSPTAPSPPPAPAELVAPGRRRVRRTGA